MAAVVLLFVNLNSSLLFFRVKETQVDEHFASVNDYTDSSSNSTGLSYSRSLLVVKEDMEVLSRCASSMSRCLSSFSWSGWCLFPWRFTCTCRSGRGFLPRRDCDCSW